MSSTCPTSSSPTVDSPRVGSPTGHAPTRPRGLSFRLVRALQSRTQRPGTLRSRVIVVLGALLTLALMGSQLVLSPAASQAATQPTDTAEKAYVSPPNLGDGSKPPAPVGTSWLVGDLDSGDLHVAKNVDKRHAPASTIKLLTALALVDVLDDHKKKVEAQFEDMEIDGTKVGLMQKNKYSIDLLFHAMLMSSANDAANALGRAAGGQDKAVTLMNEKAEELGMSNTHAVNTSGLDDKDQYTSVSDMMKLAWEVCENDYLMKIVGTETYRFPGGKNPDTKEKFKGYEIQNHTKIVGQVDGGLGLKNGYTKTAKGAYIAVAERDGHRVVSAMLGVDNNSRQAAIDLLEWDFAQKKPKSLQTIPVGEVVTASPDPTAVESDRDAGGAESGTEASENSKGHGQSSDSTDGAQRSSGVLGISSESLLPAGLLVAGVLILLGALIILIRLRRGANSR